MLERRQELMPGVVVTDHVLVLPNDTSQETALELLDFLETKYHGMRFWLADLFLFAADKWGEEAAYQFVPQTIKEQTWWQWVWVARAFPPATRRPVPYGVHRALVDLENRWEVLDQAWKDGWTEQDARDFVRGAKKKRNRTAVAIYPHDPVESSERLKSADLRDMIEFMLRVVSTRYEEIPIEAQEAALRIIEDLKAVSESLRPQTGRIG